MSLLSVLWKGGRPLRFSEIEEKLHEMFQPERISAKVLSERLAELSDLAIVNRERDFFTPKAVFYSLTDFGESLEDLISHLQEIDNELKENARIQVSYANIDNISHNIIAET